jgi:predicted esterase
MQPWWVSATALLFAAACGGSPSSASPHDGGGAEGSTGRTDRRDAGGSAPDHAGGDGAPRETSDATDGSAPGEAGGPSTLSPGQSTLTMTVAGHARTAILYVPTTATARSQLAIALHGDGDTDSNFLATSGIEPLADADGTVLIVPQGIPRNVVVQLGGGMTQTIPDVDWDAYNSAADGNIDLPFLDRLRTQIVATGQVDPNHVFVFGYSQGGYLAFMYGMVTATSLSCSAVLAASSPYGGGSTDPLITGAARKIPVVLQIGTLDEAYSAAETTETTLMSDGFPTVLHAIAGAGHVPIPGNVSVPWDYCRGETL